MFRFIKRLFGKAPATVPVIRLTGMIAASSGPRRGLSMANVAPLLDKAFDIKGAKAVALAINSPGGSPVQSALIYERIRHLSREKDIPVLAFVEDVAASGGYWLACAGDEIYVNAASVVGSIGVVSAGFGFEGAIEKLGVTRRVYTAGKRKVMLDPFQPENPDDIAHLKDLQQDIHDQFTALVRHRRGSKLTAGEDELFSGAFWTGRKAVEFGLADKHGELRQTLKERFGDKVIITLIEPKRSMFGLSSGGGGVSWADRLADAVVDSAMHRAQETTLRNRLGL
jgi:serine protease SohB